MTPVIVFSATRGAERVRPGAPLRRRTPDLLVRAVGRLPLRGRSATRRLVRQCRTATRSPDPGVRLDAWCALRHARLMNLVRHGLPVPVGVLATVGYGGAALDQAPHAPALVTGLAAAASAALTTLTALVTYVQARIHAGLRRELVAAGVDPAARAAHPAPPRPRYPVPVPVPVPERDDDVTRRLVTLAVLLTPAGTVLGITQTAQLLTR